MDTLSHALWPAALFPNARWRWVAALWGILSDLGMAGPLLYVISQDGLRQLCWITPGWVCSAAIPHYNIPDVWMLPYTLLHSFVPWVIVGVGLSLVFRKLYFPIVGWGLHILLDMTMHDGDYATQIFYPFSSYHPPFLVSWQDSRVLLVNWVLLVALLGVGFFVRKRRRKSNV
ncbi:MAG: hypothetical protein WCV85_03790 [Patescibacteria group bacterium]|jgi:hypothetical protein